MKAMELGSLDGMLMEALVFVVLLGIVRAICGMDMAFLNKTYENDPYGTKRMLDQLRWLYRK